MIIWLHSAYGNFSQKHLAKYMDAIDGRRQGCTYAKMIVMVELLCFRQTKHKLNYYTKDSTLSKCNTKLSEKGEKTRTSP